MSAERPPSNGAPPPAPRWRRLAAGLARRALPLAVLLIGAAVSAYLLRTPPKVQRRPTERRAHLVEVTPVSLGSHRTVLEAMGTVQPARRVELRPQVSGEIVEVAPEFVPGGRFAAGDVVLRIERRDYELAVEQRRSELSAAQADLAIEIGNQDVARREYELLGEAVEENERDLVLRRPQLRTARARVDSARAALEEARLDLERTTIRAPFDAVVETRRVELGAHVDPAVAMATLVGTEEFWIEATIPVGDLRWVNIPESAGGGGSPARVSDPAAWGEDVSRPGTVIRLLSDLETQGRLARLLVSVSDPLGREAEDGAVPLLLLGSFVRVEIQGRTLDGVAALDRRLLRDGDRVWVMRADGTLDIRPVSVAFGGDRRVLVSQGLQDGERVVTTDLSAPVDGMPLRLSEDHGDG